MDASVLPTLLALAVLLPLVAFFAILITGPYMGKGLGHGAFVSVGAILGSAVLAFISLFVWMGAPESPRWPETPQHDHKEHARAPALSIKLTPVALRAPAEGETETAADDH